MTMKKLKQLYLYMRKWEWMFVCNCNTTATFISLDENSIEHCWALGMCAFGPSGKYEILALI